MHLTRLRGALGALLVSLAVIGCGGASATATPGVATTAPSAEASESAPSAEATSSAEASPSATSGGGLATTGRIEVPDKGFALTLPDGWTRVDLSAGDLEAIMAAAGNVDPALAEQYSGQIQAMLAAGLAVFAFGPDPSAGSNLTVLVLPGGGLSLDLLEQLNAAQLEQLAEGGVESERVTLPAGEAIHYRYTLAAEAGAGPAIDQYLLIAGDNQLAVTITGGSAEDAEAIANSIETLD